MSLPYLMVDASRPGSSIPATWNGHKIRAVAGYVGGDTPHVWTPAEWGRFKGLGKLPVWVNNVDGDDPGPGEADAFAALRALYDLGAKQGAAVAYDLETSVVPKRAAAFTRALAWAGFTAWIYGSRSTVFGNHASGYWVADYTGRPHFPTRNSRACQYAAGVTIGGSTWDVSCIRWWQITAGKLWT